MTSWDIGTWLAVAILIVGAIGVFGFFVRDARRILRDMGRKGPGRPG